MQKKFFIDLHCHSTLKPYGRSYPNNHNSANPEYSSSIWHADKPTLWSKIKNIFFTITQFTQTDFSTLIKGNVRIIAISLSPIEKGFFSTKLGKGNAIDFLGNLISGIGKEKVDFIQHNQNYFSELINEYNFLGELNNQYIDIQGKSYKYIIVNKFNQIESALSQANVLIVVPTIEGSHVFCENNNQRYEDSEILANVEKVKNLEYPPLFISLAHHFYNEIAGHAYSLSPGIRKFIDQDFGVNTSITGLGINVIKLMLDKSKGHRILIDIKHMSRIARRQYYELLLSSEYVGQEIPIIVSHGAVNGRPSVYSDDKHDEDNGKFYGGDINIYDDELVLIDKSKGFIGLQLDERRTASKTQIKLRSFRFSRRGMLRAQSKILWNQIEHIAKVLDSANQKSWDITTIGSDFDGAVNPLNGIWTAREYKAISKHLRKRARRFLKSSQNTLRPENRIIKPQKIIDKIFAENAYEFFRRNL